MTPDLLAVPIAVQPDVHRLLDALQAWLGVRVGQGHLTVHFHADEARTIEIVQHRKLARRPPPVASTDRPA